MIFIWNPKYSVGVKLFDGQHQHFFELSNKVYDYAEKDDFDAKALITLTTEFGDYALYHLSSEEEFFTKYKYPEQEIHTLAHNAYRKKVQKYFDDLQINSSNGNMKKIAKELSDFASDWLIDHILIMDRKYKTFFNGKGIY